MVSLGDTAISVHILQVGWGCSVPVKTQSAKICLNLNLGDGGSVPVKTQSAKICLNLNFWGAGVCSVPVITQIAKICLNLNFLGVFCTSHNSKCQDIPIFELGCVLYQS